MKDNSSVRKKTPIHLDRRFIFFRDNLRLLRRGGDFFLLFYFRHFFEFLFFFSGYFAEKKCPSGGFVGEENRGDEEDGQQEKENSESEKNAENDLIKIIEKRASWHKNQKSDSGYGKKNHRGGEIHDHKKETENNRVQDVLEKQIISRFNRAPNFEVGKDDIEFGENIGERKNEDERNEDSNRQKPD